MTEKELKQLSKIDLELLGREEGIELDRRFNKQLIEIYDAKPDCGWGGTDDEGGKCDGSHLKAQAKVEEVVEEEEEDILDEDTTPPWIKLGIPERQYNRLKNSGKL